MKAISEIRGNLAAGEVDQIVQSAPWPALAVTGDGRILQWNATAGAALDPLAEGLDGLRLSFALEDQGLAGTEELHLAIAAGGADLDDAAEVVLLNISSGTSNSVVGVGLADILGDAVAEVAELIVDQIDLVNAASISRVVAAILANIALPKCEQTEVQYALAAVAANLLETRRPRFAAQRRVLTVTVDSDTPENAAIPDTALSNCLGALLDLVASDPAFGDTAVRVSPDEDGEAIRIDIAAKSAGVAVSASVLDLLAVLARLLLQPFGGDAALSAPAPDEAMLLHLRSPAETPLKAQAPKVRPGLPDLSHVSILMAEDNLTNQLVAAEMLKSMNASLSVASDGVEALELVRDRLFDILLVDIEMPRVSGLEVIRRVRASDSPQAGRPIVALTAYAMNEHRAKITEAGADGLIPKPILSIEEFGRTILGYLECGAQVTPAPQSAETVVSDDLVVMEVYNALTEAIGPEATEELLDKITIDIADVRGEIEAGAASGDMEAVRRATHILISVAGAVGAVRLQKMAESMNRLAHEGGAEPVRAEAAGALTEMDKLLEFVADNAGAMSR